MRLTLLCENTAASAPGILGEHGFSVLIETEAESFLFDTGQGHAVLHNAAQLKKDLSKVRKIFLSHGHFDHTGGLRKVLEQTGPVDVHAHPDVFLERFAVAKGPEGEVRRGVGLPETREALEALGARFVLNRVFCEAAPGTYLSGEVPRLSAFEKPDKRLVIEKDGADVPDPINDDQCLVIEAQRGLVVVLGCAHSGVINTLSHIRSKLEGQRISMVIGGTHVGFLDEDQVRETIARLEGFEIEKIGVSHCTGQVAAAKIMQAFGDRFFFANAGNTVEV